MSDHKDYLKIEEQIKNGLSGDVQKNALDFTAFLQANNFTPELNREHGGWNIRSNGRVIVFLKVWISREKVFAIILNACNFSGDPADDVREFAWSRVTFCPKGCGRSEICKLSRKRATIFGKDFEHICTAPYEFFNLNADELKKAQQLVLMLK